MQQLERLLHSQGFGTRRDCRALIRAGRVSVAGEPCDDPFAEFSPAGLVFTVDGEEWLWREHVYVLLNKPAGFECSHRTHHHPSVFGLLPAPLVQRGVQCVGRLDEDTTGLLLLSDDGQFIHALSSPKRKVPKLYAATLKHAADEGLLQVLRDGVLLHGEREPSRAVTAELRAPRELELTITEGKYHQVKRMVAAAGNRVEALRRLAVGGLALPADLAEGLWRWLEAADLARLAADPGAAGPTTAAPGRAGREAAADGVSAPPIG